MKSSKDVSLKVRYLSVVLQVSKGNPTFLASINLYILHFGGEILYLLGTTS